MDFQNFIELTLVMTFSIGAFTFYIGFFFGTLIRNWGRMVRHLILKPRYLKREQNWQQYKTSQSKPAN